MGAAAADHLVNGWLQLLRRGKLLKNLGEAEAEGSSKQEAETAAAAELLKQQG